MRTSALERAIARSAVRTPRGGTEPCALCAVELPAQHPHMVDRELATLLCVCPACAILFDRPAAAGGRYRRVGDRREALEGIDPVRLRVPVGLAFFVVGDDGQVGAHYPSPAGATRWDVDPDDWAAVVGCCPRLAGMAPEVEALLMNTLGGRADAWIVPVSDCYRLVGRVRSAWEGLSGGRRVWKEIEAFFEELRRHHEPHPSR